MKNPVDIVDELNEPEKFYPGNFETPRKANAYYSGLCQQAADEIESLRQRVKELEDELSPRVCCQDFANCQTACLPMGDHWRAKAAELEETLIDYKAELAAPKPEVPNER